MPKKPRPHWLRRPKLGPVTRVILLVAGWILLVLGIAGLVLPGLQGIFTLVLAGAVLSLVEPWSLKLLRPFFKRWPDGWRRLLRLRRRIYRHLERPD